MKAVWPLPSSSSADSGNAAERGCSRHVDDMVRAGTVTARGRYSEWSVLECGPVCPGAWLL